MNAENTNVPSIEEDPDYAEVVERRLSSAAPAREHSRSSWTDSLALLHDLGIMQRPVTQSQGCSQRPVRDSSSDARFRSDRGKTCAAPCFQTLSDWRSPDSRIQSAPIKRHSHPSPLLPDSGESEKQ